MNSNLPNRPKAAQISQENSTAGDFIKRTLVVVYIVHESEA